MNKTARLLIIALILILVGDAMAWLTQTAGGKIEIKDVRFVGSNGIIQNALLYIPPGVTSEHPAPGIVAIHGYINTNETQDGFAIEFARRGFVVLAPDQTGHGYSDSPAFANGFGGPPALAFMRTLDIVDPNNIGLEGHSMGGWASVVAAAVIPDGYKAMVLEGSSTGTYGAPDGTPTFPRNLALVFSRYDEFSALMWGSPVAADIVSTDKLKALFGTTATVVPGQLYGSIADGTARILYQPPNTHPWDHLSTRDIGYAVDWFQKTLQGGNSLPVSNQIWYWKEFGNLIALIGMVLLLFPVGELLLQTKFFGVLVEAPAPVKSATGIGWWIAAIIFAGLSAATLFSFKQIPTTLKWATTALFPQNITTAVVTWTTLLVLIDIVLFVAWHFLLNRKAKATGDNYGLTWNQKLNWAKIGKSFLLAFLITSAAYLTLVLSEFFFKVDFRFWVFAVKPLDPLQFRITLSYILPFILIFFMDAVLVFGELRRAKISLAREMWLNEALYVLGFVVLLLVQYIPLFTGGTLMNANESLWSIIAFQFLPLMTIAALVATYFNRKTGHVYVAAFLTAMLVTWIVVASTAIHFAF
jgi:pimeloyl-ACP methyl ester carboxylesterase